MSRRSGLFSALLITLAAASFPALAGGWQSYSSAFPSLPCPDGWAACGVGGVTVSPGMAKDGAGRPIPSDARVGWFDLQPTAVFSPFVGLTAYSGPQGGVVAEAPAPPVEAPPVEAPPVEAPPSQPEVDVVASAPPPPRNDTPLVAPPPSGAGRPVTPPASSTPTAPPPSGSVAKTTPPPATTPPVTPTTPPPAGTAKQGTSLAPPATTTTAPPVGTAPPATTAKVVAPPTPAAAGDDSCADLVKLEPQAMLGQLRPGQAKCIEGRIGTEGAQTTKDKLSRVLIANAEGKGDKAEWEKLVKRHLEDIDRSDPDMCFKYATQLSRGGTGRALGVIRWADYALENKQKWTGTTYTKRVYDLYRMKTEAANKLWADAEEVYATKEHTEENEAKAVKWRGQTKDFAREWLDYAKASSQDTKNAMAICVSAAGNKSFCDG